MKIWTTTALDREIAEKFFGWKWVSYIGIPVKGTPGYPEETRVRRMLSPTQQKMPEWIEYMADYEGSDADGTEPLAYCYCSSQGPPRVPHFSGDWNEIFVLEKEIGRRGLTEQYQKEIVRLLGVRVEGTDCELRCLAALNCLKSNEPQK